MILTELAQRYNLDNGFLNRISNHPLRLDAWAREFISELRRNTKSKIEDITPVEAGTQILSNALKNEFSFNFLRRGLEIVRMGMMTMTQEEQAEIDISNKNIIRHVDNHSLDSEAQLLREKIGIDQLKLELDIARRGWDEIKIEEAELRATNRLMEVLHEYPYQLTKNKHGYKLSKMIATKEIFCVGYSLLWHAFLSELWIWHQVLDNIFHSAIIINQSAHRKKYYFDPFIFKRSHEIHIKPQKYGSYMEMYWVTPVSFSLYGREGNAEILLLSQIYNSKWTEMFSLGNGFFQTWEFTHAIWLYKEAIEMYNLAIELNPQYGSAYNSIWITLIQKFRAIKKLKQKIPKKEYDTALEAFEKAVELFPLFNDISKNIGRVRSMSDPDWESIGDTGIDEFLTNNIAKWSHLFENARYLDADAIYDEIIDYCDNILRTDPTNQKIRTLKKETQEKKRLALYCLAYILRTDWKILEANECERKARSI